MQFSLFNTENDSRICVYGKCYYCKPEESICANKANILEGVVLLEIPGQFVKHRSPWQRSYKEGQKAPWQMKRTDNYCDSVKRKLDGALLLDLIDASIFDFLIQNGDRHHVSCCCCAELFRDIRLIFIFVQFETKNGRVMLIDNGKGFGNPHVDFIDILAPVYQCCV